jgi:hypothetical protein
VHLCRSIAGARAETVEEAAGERDNARPFPIQPQTAEEAGNSQDKNGDRKRKSYFLNRPMELLCEGNPENTPRVNCAKGHLHQEARCCEPPAIHARDTIPPGLFHAFAQPSVTAAAQLDLIAEAFQKLVQ